MAGGAVARPLAVAVAFGVEEAGGQWARDRGGLAGATMLQVTQGNIGASEREPENSIPPSTL